MESTEVFASGASCVNDEAAPAGPMLLFGALALFALLPVLMLRSLHGERVRASFEAAPGA